MRGDASPRLFFYRPDDSQAEKFVFIIKVKNHREGFKFFFADFPGKLTIRRFENFSTGTFDLNVHHEFVDTALDVTFIERHASVSGYGNLVTLAK